MDQYIIWRHSMSSLLRATPATIAFLLMFSASVSTARAQQKLTAEQTQIVDTVSTIFTAARADDLGQFDSVIGPNFYIFDGGARFNGDSIMAFIKAQHVAGKRYEWNVTEPDVHITGNATTTMIAIGANSIILAGINVTSIDHTDFLLA